MSEITLAKSYIHDYDGSNGRELYNFDVNVIRHVLSVGTRDFGWGCFIVDEVGTSCYRRVRINYEGDQIFNAQETRNGDWWVNWCSLPITERIWQYILKV